jgi:hypothetical protein
MTPDPANWTVASVIAYYEDRYDRLSGLRPPDRLRSVHAELLRSVRETIENTRELPSAGARMPQLMAREAANRERRRTQVAPYLPACYEG